MLGILLETKSDLTLSRH